MEIHIASGVGEGPTKLSAFDSALHAAGVANYNLLTLSSVIPANSKLVVHTNEPIRKPPGEWGDRLYVVKAELRVDTPNAEAWAGVGWVQDRKTGRGLFVEHAGGNKEAVHRDIDQSLAALLAIRNLKLGPIHRQVVGTTCTHRPVCALVVAVYRAAGWDIQLAI